MRTGDVSEDANACSTRVVQSRATSRSSRRHCPTRVSLRNLARCRRAHAASLRMRRKRKVVRDRERRKEGRARGLASNPAAMSLLHDASTAWYGVHASLRYSTRSTASGGGALGGAIGGWEGHARPMEVKPSSFFCERSKRPRLTGQPRHRPHRLQAAAGVDFGVTGLFSTGTVDRADRRVGEKRLESIGKLSLE